MSHSSAAKVSQAIPAKAKAFRQVLVVLGEVQAWSGKAKALVQKELPEVQIAECAEEAAVFPLLQECDLAVILCLGRTKDEILKSFNLAQAIRTRSKDLLLNIAILGSDEDTKEVESLERRGIVVFPQGIFPKPLRLKLELQFSRMKAILQKKLEADPSLVRYLIPDHSAKKAERPATVMRFAHPPEAPFKDLHLKPSQEADGNIYRFKDEKHSRKWNAHDLSPDELAGSHLHQEAKYPEAVNLLQARAGRPHILLISKRSEDMMFALELAQLTQANLHVYVEASSDVARFLAQNPDSVVLWDVDENHSSKSEKAEVINSIGSMLSRSIRPAHVFALSSYGVNRLSHLLEPNRRAFTHTILRGKQNVNHELYSLIFRAILKNDPFGLGKYFIGRHHEQQIDITHSAQRRAAVEATQSFLLKQGLQPRLTRQVAQGTDELLLNSIFDAPVDANGHHFKRGMPRDSKFALEGHEIVTLSVMSNREYFGVCVRDNFGSLSVNAVLTHLYKNYSLENCKVNVHASRDVPADGIGLNRVMGSGLSLLLAVKPREITEVFLFFPRADTYKEFRSKFRFLAAITIG